ncbi:MAG: aminotransferase class I/II-fold pyridoxal phosphate-dependent enzyme [Anaerolineae bacterium]|jgi:glutamate/tyrosine decarboxylase-like PLP-dependent enzyme
MEPDPSLTLSPDEMRRLGYAVVDALVEHLTGLADQPLGATARRPEAERLLREPLPAAGRPPLEVLERVRTDVLGHILHADHPRFFAFVPGPGNFVGAMADALASGFNVFHGTWLEGSGPAQVELVTLDWLREACGLPATGGGLFVSGGSMANITALAVARYVRLAEEMDGAVVYCSDQTHSSIERGLRVLGFRADQLRTLPSDDAFKLDIMALEQAVRADRAAGRVPFCVVANAGTTNTGTVDPLPQLAEFCEAHDLWLHVDGAYGAAAALCPRGRSALAGLGRAHSLALDPHKWLFQPFEMGCVLVRQEEWLKEAFQILPEYLADVAPGEEEVNFCDRGIQLSRRFRALKLWMSLQVFGGQAFAAAQTRGMALAEAVEAEVRRLPDWEVVTPAQLAVVTFRYAPPGRPVAAQDEANRELAAALREDGWAMVSTTRLRGRTVVRMCTINPRTTEADVRQTIRRLDALARRSA